MEASETPELVDLNPFIERAPLTIDPSAEISKVLLFFRFGVPYLFVTSRGVLQVQHAHTKPKGVVSKRDFVKSPDVFKLKGEPDLG